MAYDRDLADRLRAALDGTPEIEEKQMFGGLAFMCSGSMAIAAGSKGDLMVRVDPAAAEELMAQDHVEPMMMRGRPTKGFLRVEPAGVPDRPALDRWVAVGLGAAQAAAAAKG